MAEPNALKTVKEWSGTGKINPRYDATVGAFRELYNAYTDLFDLVSAAFVYGYAQGHKAAQAEYRKEAANQ